MTPTLSEHQLLTGLLALAVMLLLGRGTAAAAKRLGQPEVLGELIGGFLLGPSVLGVIAPAVRHTLFSDPGVVLPISFVSWMGAILLLILAGAEVDLSVLLTHWKPGFASACGVIVPSIIGGAAFGYYCLHLPLPSAIYLGATLSVTAVGVIAKLFIERNILRRTYAQVILAAGIASEIVVWPIISALSSVKEGHSAISGVFTALYGVVFFSLMLTLGQKCMDWAMRRITDVTQIGHGPLTFIIVLGMIFACVTQEFGLHALLGPFAVGLLVARAPRSNSRVRENLQAITMSLFAPVFFVSAGMRIDATKTLSFEALLAVASLFAAAMIIKLTFGFLGARMGGLTSRESLLVGLGANMKGGTDVIVAILGVSLGLLTDYIYSIYALVAMLTVFVSPAAINFLGKGALPDEAESERLKNETAKKRAYFSSVEKVLLPSYRPFRPLDCMSVLKLLALGKDSQKEIFDIMELEIDHDDAEAMSVKSDELKTETDSAKVEYLKSKTSSDPLESMAAAAQQCDLVLMGAARPENANLLTFGPPQDRAINKVKRDFFITVDGGAVLKRRLNRILVPINGLEHSLAAADIAGYLAEASNAEITFLTVVHHEQKVKKGELAHYRISKAGAKILKEANFRMRRLNVITRDIVKISDDVNGSILDVLRSGNYDMVVLGAVDRTTDSGIYLGKCIQMVLTETRVPAGILIYRSSQEKEGSESDGAMEETRAVKEDML